MVRVTDQKFNDLPNFMPVHLKWVDYPEREVELNRTQFEYLNVFFATNDNQYHIAARETERRSVTLCRSIGSTHILRIEVYAENAKPVARFLHLSGQGLQDLKVHVS